MNNFLQKIIKKKQRRIPEHAEKKLNVRKRKKSWNVKAKQTSSAEQWPREISATQEPRIRYRKESKVFDHYIFSMELSSSFATVRYRHHSLGSSIKNVSELGRVKSSIASYHPVSNVVEPSIRQKGRTLCINEATWSGYSQRHSRQTRESPMKIKLFDSQQWHSFFMCVHNIIAYTYLYSVSLRYKRSGSKVYGNAIELFITELYTVWETRLVSRDIAFECKNSNHL